MASQVEHIKWVPGTRFMVDGFAFSNSCCRHYFLTHCHSDHTIGLSRTFNAGTIYCSPVSARLLAHEKGLRAPVVQVLQLGVPLLIDGVTITAVDANHCPGAVMLLFEVPKANGGTTNILHTGDCRWQDHLLSCSCLASKRVDVLMLDTTYALPRYTFPSQQRAVEMMVQVMRCHLDEEPATLFVVGSYHIGKERAYLGAAHGLGAKVYAGPAKRRLLQLLDLPSRQLELLTDDASSACVHVAAMGTDPEKLQAYVDAPGSCWKRVVGFRPTGWSYRRSGGLQVRRQGHVVVYGIPYSEHSSWNDLRACVAALRPKRIIPTVNASSKAEAAAIVERFVDLMDLSSNRGRMDMFLAPACKSGTPKAFAAAGAAGATAAALQAAASEPALCAFSLQEKPSSACTANDCSTAMDDQTASRACIKVCCSSSVMVEVLDDVSCSTKMNCSAGPVSSCAELQCVKHYQEPATTSPPGSPGSNHLCRQQSSRPLAPCQEKPCMPSAALCLPGEGIQEQFDLGSIDIAEQQRLLHEAERRQRLKRSLQLQRSAKETARQRRRQTQAG